jgi:putative nucleotidyltransferase with HDIG domain
VLRVLGEQAYLDDPLRPLRLPRLAASLGFAADPATAELTKKHAAAVTEAAPERAFAELRGLLCSRDPLRGLALLDEFGLTQELLPELAALQGVEQSVYHHLDAYGHTLEVLERYIEIQADPAAVFGEHGAPLAALLTEPIADEMSRGEALRWAALLHDIAKSETRVELPDGRIGFPGHDKRGAEIVRAICKRFKTSEKFSAYVAALTRHHLRLGFLVHARPLPRRDVYAYLRACEPVEVEVGVLSVADRLATRGRKSDEAIAAHLELAEELTASALDWRANPPAALVRGDDLAESLGVSPGRVIGAALDAIAEQQYVGSVNNRDEAVALAKRLYADGSLTP